MLDKKIFLKKTIANNYYGNSSIVTTSFRSRLTYSHIKAIETFYPVFCIPFQYSVVNFFDIFSRTAPICVEIGFGIGENLLHLANIFPQKNFLGIEVYWPGIAVFLKRAYEMNLKNVRIVGFDVLEVINFMIGNDELSYVQLFFPDPWPKRKHHKRRIIKSSFLALLSNKLKNNGILHIATDWKSYAVEIMNCIEDIKCFSVLDSKNTRDYQVMPRLETRFEMKGKKLGYEIFEFVVKKTR